MVDRDAPAVEALTAATFEPVRVRRASGARGRLVTAAWVLGLVGIVGLALVGRLTELRVASVSVVAVAPPKPASPPPGEAPADAPALVPGDVIVLTSPADGDPTITAPELFVQGFVVADAATLRVILEAGGDRVDDATVSLVPAIRDRPNAKPHARFLVRVELPTPRPIGPMVVQVAAVDRAGHRLAVIRRPFQLGRVARPTLGDDGLVGGLVFAGG